MAASIFHADHANTYVYGIRPPNFFVRVDAGQTGWQLAHPSRITDNGDRVGRQASTGSPGGLDLLEQRYTRGEVNREEYLQKKGDLQA